MKKSPIAMLAATLVLLAGCTRTKVYSDPDLTYDFSRISTYQWVAAPQELLGGEENYVNGDMQQALNNELAARGWRQVLAASNATVQATYFISIVSHDEYTDNRTPQTEGELVGGVVYKRGEQRMRTLEEEDPNLIIYRVEVGTVHLKLTDTDTDRTIWTGSITSTHERPYLKSLPETAPHLAKQLIGELPGGARR